MRPGTGSARRESNAAHRQPQGARLPLSAILGLYQAPAHTREARTKTFTDPRLCAAIVDRLTFAGQIIETGTTSYRLAHARQRRAAS
jgi:hypothetical protein